MKKKHSERPSEAEILRDYVELKEDGVYSKKQGKFLKVYLSRGYEAVTIRISKGNYKTYRLHRLIAEKLIPKVPGKNHINHKNGIKNDNRVENLEWCTQSENVQHAYDIGLKTVSSNQRLAGGRNGRKCGAENLKKAREVMRIIRENRKRLITLN